jgi:hypothetical protein
MANSKRPSGMGEMNLFHFFVGMRVGFGSKQFTDASTELLDRPRCKL